MIFILTQWKISQKIVDSIKPQIPMSYLDNDIQNKQIEIVNERESG